MDLYNTTSPKQDSLPKKWSVFLLFYFLISTPVIGITQTAVISFYFDSNKTVPTYYSKIRLAKFKEQLQQDSLQLKAINAFSDTTGTFSVNQKIANERLEYVLRYLELGENNSLQKNVFGAQKQAIDFYILHWRRVDIYFYQKDSENNQDSTDNTSHEPARKIVPQPTNAAVNSTSTEVDHSVKDSLVYQEQNELISIPAPSLTTESNHIQPPENVTSEVENQPLLTIDTTATYILSIHFLGGTDKMTYGSKDEIVRFYTFLAHHQHLKVQIRGHVCCGKNKRISTKRAKAVYRELVTLGIPKKRLKYIGMSNKAPLRYPEKTADDRSKNRRVDVVFI
jgi:outer membrane protein OmpA-like peptidoglycan-associated protein